VRKRERERRPAENKSMELPPRAKRERVRWPFITIPNVEAILAVGKTTMVAKTALRGKGMGHKHGGNDGGGGCGMTTMAVAMPQIPQSIESLSEAGERGETVKNRRLVDIEEIVVVSPLTPPSSPKRP